MLKKMMLLAVSAAALVAFAVPASASAATDWTHNGSVVGNNVDLTESFEGFLSFDTGIGSFGCDVTVKLTVTGPTSAEITEFNPTTASCVGTGMLVTCHLANDTSNVPWTVTNGTGNVSITKSGGNVTVFNEYKGGECPLGASSDLQFASITATPEIEEGKITELTISGTSTVGVPATGTVFPEAGTTELGLD
jgi:opacity protein-like surface antigen